MLEELLDANVEAEEGVLVRRQHQRLCGELAITRQRPEVLLERIGLGLARIDADVRRDLGQDLIARDHQPELLAVEAGLLGRVAAAHHHAPGTAADVDALAVDDAPVGLRDRRHALAVVAVAATPDPLQGLLAEAGAAVERDHRLRRPLLGVEAQHAAEQPFGPSHPQLGPPALGEPAGEAQVIGVKVGGEDPRDRPAVQRLLEDLLPELADPGVAQAAVDQAPALAVRQQPQIDVIEAGDRQRHAQPLDPRRDLTDLALRRRGGEGVPYVTGQEFGSSQGADGGGRRSRPSARHSRLL